MSVRISITVTNNSKPARVVGWRGLHVGEGGRVPDQSIYSPEVIPPFNPTVSLEMTRSIQYMSYDLMAYFHPAVKADREKWRICHGHSFAMNNKPQNGYDGGIPHRDYINQRDLLSTFPRYDKMQRTFAGSLITGKSEGKLIWCTPGIDALDASSFIYEPGTPEAAKILEQVIAKRWYSYAVADGDKGPFKIKGHWGEGIIVFPFLLDRPVSFESRFFVAWDAAFPPDPLEVYKPLP